MGAAEDTGGGGAGAAARVVVFGGGLVGYLRAAEPAAFAVLDAEAPIVEGWICAVCGGAQGGNKVGC